MKISGPVFPTLLGLFLLVLTPAHGQSQLHKDATLPAHPTTLLAVLPKTPSGWEMTTSRGETADLAWLTTHAERSFKKVQFAEGENPNLPPVTRIHVRDTGNYPGYLSRFARFQPDPPESTSSPRKMLVNSFPAYVTQEGSGMTVNLLAGKRYLVDLVLENQPPASMSVWLQAFDFRALSAIATTPLSSKPSEAQMITIDELNPDNNRVIVVTLTRVDMSLKTAGGQLSEEDRAELAASQEEARAIAAEAAADAAAAANPAGAQKNPNPQ